MDTRLIFRDQPGRTKASGHWLAGDRPARLGRSQDEGAYVPEVLLKTVEKSRRRTNWLTVLKPTQVGEMNILRRSRERW